MARIPKTSTTMLKQIAGAAGHPRWEEFVAKYRPLMEVYARERFPGLETDDLVQETLLGLMRALPGYIACEDRKGAFHLFLKGVLRHKALDALRKAGRRSEAESLAAADWPSGEDSPGEAWRKTLYEVGLEQLLANPRLGARSKQIFVRTVLRGESPREVADSLLVSRNVVDVTNQRMKARLKKIVESLKNVDGH